MDPEIKNRAFKLAMAVYRITDRFPSGEVLKKQIRKSAIEILRDISRLFYYSRTTKGQIIGQKESIQKIIIKIGVIRDYFKLAISQNWVKEINLEILDREYQGLENQLKSSPLRSPTSKGSRTSRGVGGIKSVKSETSSLSEVGSPLSSRQEKILDYFKTKKESRIGNLFQVVPTCSLRTLRRDCEKLVNLGFIERNGKNKGTVYKIRF